MTTNTERSVLAHHGIAAPAHRSIVDTARDHGVLTACLGCGTVVVAPEGFSTEDYYQAQPWARETIASGAWDCCPDAETITY
jgi:hypothetical protein